MNSSETSWDQSTIYGPQNQIAVPLVARLGDEGRVSGTACLIAPYLAITAKHVMVDDFKTFAGRDPNSNDDSEHNTIAYITPTFQTRKERYIVHRTFWSTLTDIALLWLQPVNRVAPKHDWSRPYLKLTPPKIGSRVRAFGFPSSKFQIKEPGVGMIELNPIITSGVVRDVHHDRRDLGKYPFPCFQVNARFDGGMSGGPVFDDAGSVCGLVCGNLRKHSSIPVG